MAWKRFLLVLGLVLLSPPSRADFGNYNSVLLGDRAAGMGGAFTALSDDPAACSFYNPASLSRMAGSSFSASASIYNKYDTSFSDTGNFSDSVLKINRGSFQAIPSSAGSALAFGTFAIGLSIVNPDYNLFNGDITLNSQPNATTFVNFKDQSLWVGGNLAINFTDQLSLGMTLYYTSRDFERSTTQQSINGTNSIFSLETKSYTTNNFVYLLGALYQLPPHFKVGLSWRLPSIQLSGSGSYYKSVLDTGSSNIPLTTSLKDLQSETHIPAKLALGIAYEIPKKLAIDFDAQYYTQGSFEDLVSPTAGERISYRPTLNYAVGAEYYPRSWLAVRGGVFTNFSSHPDIDNASERQSDHIDMMGFSLNVGIFTGQTSFTFGGYMTGGRGQSIQPVAQQLTIVPTVEYIYSMLIASSYYF